MALAVAALVAALGVAGPAFASLPEGRVYEMVSPSEKGGYEVEVPWVAPDGESVVFSSLGVFAGILNSGSINPYLARRSAGGWVTSSLSVPPLTGPVPGTVAQAIGAIRAFDVSSDMSRSVLQVPFARVHAEEGVAPVDTLFMNVGGSFEQVPLLIKTVSGEPVRGLELEGSSPNLEHIILDVAKDNPSRALLPSDTISDGTDLYEVAGALTDSPSLRLVGVNNAGRVIDPECTVLPVHLGSEESVFHAVSANGSEIFFTTNVNPAEGTKCDLTGHPGEALDNPAELFVRINGSRTLEVSKPLTEACSEVPCPGVEEHPSEHATAVFQGASEDGSKVFFTTTQPLVPGDKDTSKNLYMATIEGEAVTGLEEVSRDPHAGQAAEVQGNVLNSPDGSHVYFVAGGVLAGENAEKQFPLAGADNLYVYDTATRTTMFVAELCSGTEASGTATGVAHCPGPGSDEELWDYHEHQPGNAENREMQTTGNGRFLVFTAYAQLTPDDTDTAKDVYRYDALTERLVRVSVGEGGYDADGNNSAFSANITAPNFSSAATNVDEYEMNSRAITEDGSRIVFYTAEPLSPLAINGQADVYVWHEGQVGLISSGTSPEPDVTSEVDTSGGKIDGTNPVITPSGRDIFFTTTAGLVPQDVDGVRDIYDARIGGGFPPTSASVPAGCSGESCQGPLTLAPGPLVAGSVAQAPEASPAATAPAAPAKSKPKALTRAQKLTKALRACANKPRRMRAACRASAERRYGGGHGASKSDRRAGSSAKSITGRRG